MSELIRLVTNSIEMAPSYLCFYFCLLLINGGSDALYSKFWSESKFGPYIWIINGLDFVLYSFLEELLLGRVYKKIQTINYSNGRFRFGFGLYERIQFLKVLCLLILIGVG